jgi:hypothetical protein
MSGAAREDLMAPSVSSEVTISERTQEACRRVDFCRRLPQPSVSAKETSMNEQHRELCKGKDFPLYS